MSTSLLILCLFNYQHTEAEARQSARGSLVVCGGGAMPDAVFRRFRALAGDGAVELVVIPTASSRTVDVEETSRLWKSRGFPRVTVLHTRDRQVANTAAFVAPLQKAHAVWFGGGQQQRIADAYVGTRVAKELHKVLARGGVVGGTSAGAAIQSRVMIAGGREEPRISQGLDLLKETIVDQHFLRRDRIGRLMKAVRKHPSRVGLGIDEGTALVVEKGRATVVGRSYVLRFAAGDEGLNISAHHEGSEIVLPVALKSSRSD